MCSGFSLYLFLASFTFIINVCLVIGGITGTWGAGFCSFAGIAVFRTGRIASVSFSILIFGIFIIGLIATSTVLSSAVSILSNFYPTTHYASSQFPQSVLPPCQDFLK